MRSDRKKILALLLALVMSASAAFALTGCGSDEEEQPPAATEEEEIDVGSLNLMDNPEATKAKDPKLESKAKKLNEAPESFYGTWVSNSADTENLYGNLEITILENGTFKANITGENLKGTWKKIDGGIEYKNEYISGKIYYGPTCIMTFEEFTEDGESDEDIEVVLTKKEK